MYKYIYSVYNCNINAVWRTKIMKRNWYLIATKYDTDMFQQWAYHFTEKIAFYIALLILRRSMRATEGEIFDSLKPPKQTIYF